MSEGGNISVARVSVYHGESAKKDAAEMRGA